MVTFSCDSCNDTVKKPKANQHAQRCRSSLTCIDCSKTFWSGEWGAHNACISEAEAYQGALYKPTKKELKRKAAEQAAESAKATKLVVETPASAVVAPLDQVLPGSGNAEVPKSKKQKESNGNARETESESAINSLRAIIPDGQPMSLHKALKLLKAQKDLRKDSEKALLRSISIVKDNAGSLRLE